jgi:hypothetical protein
MLPSCNFVSGQAKFYSCDQVCEIRKCKGRKIPVTNIGGKGHVFHQPIVPIIYNKYFLALRKNVCNLISVILILIQIN